ncbi:hypothetical protein FGE12_07090 [Aggregicoccus sp. 17bor-14]|uniref:tetratricopeptide repeat protein n=1 Tax=Myxococcaceae TaxID=31 RepID=UPI00129C84F8|nr:MULTISPECIES: tetratricopeptide repeat protein [Myxococcaceae]MBF5042155.1 hypothetical protein [Simulacricoccus sp. 17bor-14]MRI87932.1 hypothetical protein [Aggregicoccus sp. 17bor-14]
MLRSPFLPLLLVLAGCASHRRAPANAPAPRYVLLLAPLHAKSPEAQAEAQRQQEQVAATFALVAEGMPVTLVQRAAAAPASEAEAAALARAQGVDATLWGEVGVTEGKLTVHLRSTLARGDDLGSWIPATYAPQDEAAAAARERDSIIFAQSTLYGVNLWLMLRDQPREAAQLLSQYRVLRAGDFVDWNPDLISRRWGMLGRLERDGVAAEKAYRRALEDIAEVHRRHPETSPPVNKEAFYKVGLARAFLLQGRAQEAVSLLQAVLAQPPTVYDGEVRRILGRALLAVGDAPAAAQVLEPVRSAKDPDTVALRLYVATGQPRFERKDASDFERLLLGIVWGDAARLAALVQERPAGEWPVPLARQLQERRVDERALEAAAHAADPVIARAHRCELHYLLGEAALAGLVTGKRDPEAARRHFEAALATRAFANDGYELADAALEQLRR